MFSQVRCPISAETINGCQPHDHPASFGRYLPVDEGITGDVRLSIEHMVTLLEEAEHQPNPGWLERVQERMRAHDPRDDFVDQSTSETLDIRTASIRLNEVLPRSRNLVSDIGRFIYGAWPHIEVRQPHGFTSMGAFGSVGLGLGAALGAAAACPDVPTVCVIGDGGFMMSPTEFATAARERLQLIVVVFDDGAYGFEWHKMIHFGANPDHSLLQWPDLASVAEALGANSRTIRSVTDLDEVPALAEDLDRPLVLVVKLDPTLNIAQ